MMQLTSDEVKMLIEYHRDVQLEAAKNEEYVKAQHHKNRRLQFEAMIRPKPMDQNTWVAMGGRANSFPGN